MQSEKMQIQLCPQLVALQDQLKSVIVNHQMVFRRYQNEPENADLRDRLDEMVLQIKNLSNHQQILVQQLKGDLQQKAPVTSCISAPVPSAVSATPIMVAAGSMAVGAPLGPLSPRPQLLTIQPHTNLGIVVPLAHVQAQPQLMSIPNFLSQSAASAIMAPAPSIVSLQLSTPSSLQLSTPSSLPLVSAPSPAILTPPTPSSGAAQVSLTASKQNQANTLLSGVKVNPVSVLQAIQPRRPSPPIKVPHYTANHPPNNNNNNNNQGPAGGKGSEKNNGALHRRLSDSDVKDIKRLEHSAKNLRKALDSKNLTPAEKEKQGFMARLGLVTQDTLKELQNKRVERKRRTTANPHSSYTLDAEKRRNNENNTMWLMGGTFPPKRIRNRPVKSSPSNSRPSTPDSLDNLHAFSAVDSEEKPDLCAECGKGGQLLLCGTCCFVYHLHCLSPPLVTPPVSPWSCPACVVSGKAVGTLTNGALSMVNSYIAAKANKEDEKRKLQRKNLELTNEKQCLEDKTNSLKQQIEEKRLQCERVKEASEEKKSTVDTLKAFVKSFQDPPPPPPATLASS